LSQYLPQIRAAIRLMSAWLPLAGPWYYSGMSEIQLAACLVVNPRKEVLLSRGMAIDFVPSICDTDSVQSPVFSVEFELPHVVARLGLRPDAVLRGMLRQRYKLDITRAELSKVLTGNSGPGPGPECQLFSCDIRQDLELLDDDDWHFVDLRKPSHRTPNIALGPVAEALRWQIQNNEITL